MFILLIAIIMISIGFLSGCIDTTDETTDNDGTDEDTDEVELVTYKIETFGAELGSRPEKIGDGFIHNETAKNGYYKITGTIKNIAGKTLINITIKADFYDINNIYLESLSHNISTLQDSETAEFNILCYGTESYFENVEKLEFGILIGGYDTTDNDGTTEETDKIELVNYTVETFGGEFGLKPEKIGDGFIHTEEALNGYYQIKGTIKNIAGRTLNNITIKVDSYDINNTYLGSEYSKSENIFYLPLANNETADFKVNIIGMYTESYYEYVEQIGFNITGIYSIE
jgi:hypothetical protein